MEMTKEQIEQLLEDAEMVSSCYLADHLNDKDTTAAALRILRIRQIEAEEHA